MDKDRQIEEMAKDLNDATFGVNVHTLADHLKPETISGVAEYLYNAGFRKIRTSDWLIKHKSISDEELQKQIDEEFDKAAIALGYRKQSEGEWILTGTFKSTFPLPVADLHKACSVCGWIPPKYSTDYKEYKFCPNCGAKMTKGDVD